MIGFMVSHRITVHMANGVSVTFEPHCTRVVEMPDGGWGLAGRTDVGEVFIPSTAIMFVQELET